ncbi:hypothetical protein CEXT_259561 [Caerostris extrusa]|uniref:Uncharacterized protein n=1 Tax=Caerostris extrusa TaxID=172846 RepID=A0AAV4SNM4_CAEEX|nr:hypothetical protein CEXT_259561 [Caerostris extrusa]
MLIWDGFTNSSMEKREGECVTFIAARRLKSMSPDMLFISKKEFLGSAPELPISLFQLGASLGLKCMGMSENEIFTICNAFLISKDELF